MDRMLPAAAGGQVPDFIFALHRSRADPVFVEKLAVDGPCTALPAPFERAPDIDAASKDDLRPFGRRDTAKGRGNAARIRHLVARDAELQDRRAWIGDPVRLAAFRLRQPIDE